MAHLFRYELHFLTCGTLQGSCCASDLSHPGGCEWAGPSCISMRAMKVTRIQRHAFVTAQAQDVVYTNSLLGSFSRDSSRTNVATAKKERMVSNSL